MKRLVVLIGALLAATDIMAATIVLKDGKRLEATSYTVNGSYVIVQYDRGRMASYPIALVDLQATKDANGVRPHPVAVSDAGPHSPFLAARSSGKVGGPLVTDADVKHAAIPEPGQGEKKDENSEAANEGQVVLVSYDKKKVGDNEWEITATVANQGKATVTGVNATMRVLDKDGKAVASGSGSLAGRLEPGKEGTIVGRVSVEGEPAQVAFDLTWQKILPAPTPAPAGAQPTPPPPAWSIPEGASPNTLVSNPMAPVTAGAAPQVPPPAPKKE
jgi:hypothetical protein